MSKVEICLEGPVPLPPGKECTLEEVCGIFDPTSCSRAKSWRCDNKTVFIGVIFDPDEHCRFCGGGNGKPVGFNGSGWAVCASCAQFHNTHLVSSRPKVG